MNILPINYNKTDCSINYQPNFKAMKKSQFNGVALGVIEKYKAPIEKFNNYNDLQIWAKNLVKNITSKKFFARQEKTETQRTTILQDWINYLQSNKKIYPAMIQLLVLAGITKELKNNNDKLPPELNKSILDESLYELTDKLYKQPKMNFDFDKLYQKKLQEHFLTDDKKVEKDLKWVIIPSRNNDSKNFQANVEKLKALSAKSWCTKSFNAEPYLENGDCHIYLENHNPKICIRFFGKDIIEFQGELNNSQIPLQYLDAVLEHIKTNNLTIENSTKAELNQAIEKKQYVDKIKAELKDEIENKQYDKILNYFGIKQEKDIDKHIILSHYSQPDKCTFADLGINENEMLKDVTTITGNADFSNSSLTTLGNIKTIDGNLYLGFSDIYNLGSLKNIGGSANFANSYITDLGNLNSIAKNADFGFSKIKSLGNLNFIGGYANFRGSQVEILGNLKIVGGNVIFSNSKISTLDNLKSIFGKAMIANSRISKEDLKSICKEVI